MQFSGKGLPIGLALFSGSVFATQLAADSSVSTYDTDVVISWDNDVVAQDDGGYTNGFSVTWVRTGFTEFDEKNSPDFARWLASPLPVMTASGKQRAFTHAIVHEIYTPENLSFPFVIPNDVPYSGSLYWRGGMHAWGESVADSVYLSLGVLGDLSGAEHIQEFVHEITDSTDPEGWDNQLDNEPIVNIGFTRRWRWLSESAGGLEMDVVPVVHGEAGTLTSWIGGGGAIRFGSALADSYQGTTIDFVRTQESLDSSVRDSWYVAIGSSGRYVFNDMRIEGNIWSSSPGLDLENGQYSIFVKCVYGWANYTLSGSFTNVSEQAEEKDGSESFASLSFSWQL